MTPHRFRFGTFAVLFVFLFAMLTMSGTAMASPGTSVVISQVYGGGGNSGATYKNDFIEIFNPTSTTLTLTGYSVQYASSTGTSYQVTNLPATVSLSPGQYFLIQEAAGTGGTTALPTPDVTGTINMSATTGKVALVSSTTALSGACPTSDPTLADFVGFGGANCSLGSPTAVLTNTTAAIRTPVCVNAGNNSTDFTAAAPAPHNSASAFTPCGASVPLSATAKATPATVYTGTPTLVTVQVTPASSPVSTGITIQADLSSIGGSSTQPLYDDGSHGDVTAGDNIFSFSISPTTVGTFTLPVSVVDSQLRTTTASASVTVQTAPAFVSIRTIQANKPSTYATQTVTTSGIVVGVKSSGFYLEAKDADTTPVTPEGILIYTGSTTLPSFVVPGAEVQVTGVVNTYPTTGPTPGTEIDAPQTFTLLTSGNALPAPVTITAAMDSPTGGIRQFSKFEGMRVAIGSLTTTSGTDATLTETTETNVSDGLFYGVVTGVPRPFREPGLSLLEPSLPAGTNECSATVTTNCVPVWDSNPELLEIDSKSFGGPAIDLTSNTILTNVVGVMDFSSGTPEIFMDAATRPTVSGGMTAVAVPAQAANEFTVASFNMERFYNDISDADNPGSTVVVVTSAAYQRRLAKASLAIRNILNFPDVIGAQEIENINVLTDLANKISADAIAAGQTDPVYLPYLFLATDGTAINTGMLVKSTRVTTVRAEQFGLTTTFTNSTGAQAVLNDRTPLVLHLGIKRGTGLPDYPVTVISVHQRSLISIDDTTSTGATVRLKREAQAEYLASLIQGYQAAGEHVITVGDYNSFEFSDGYVDTMGVTLGTPVPAATVITAPKAGLANPPLVDLVTLLPATQRQSYVETGSAQVLDHVVVTGDLVPTETRLVYAHIDADFPLVDLNDATTPMRVSDHDPAVAYFTVPTVALASVSASSLTFGPQLVTTATAAKTVTLTNGGTGALTISSITATGTGFTTTSNCGTSVAAGGSCTISAVFTPTTTASVSGSISVVSNAGTSPTVISLTGSGSDFTIAPFSPTQTIINGTSGIIQLTVSSVGSYAGTLTLTCGGLVKGETCALTPTSVLLAAGGTTLVFAAITTTAQNYAKTGQQAGNHAPAGGAGGVEFALGGISFAALLGCFSQRRLRAYRKTLSLCMVLAALAMIAGCSGTSTTANPNGTPSGTQTVTITATSGTVSRTANVTVTVP